MSRDPGLLQTDVSPALRWLRGRLLSLARHCLLGLSLATLGLILAGAAELYTASLDQLSVSRFGGISGFEGGDTLLDRLAPFAPETWQMLALLLLVLAELAILFPRRIIRLLYHPATAALLFLAAFALLIPAWNIRDQLPACCGLRRNAAAAPLWSLAVAALAVRAAFMLRERIARRSAHPDSGPPASTQVTGPPMDSPVP